MMVTFFLLFVTKYIIWTQFPVLPFFARHGLFAIWILLPTINAFLSGKIGHVNLEFLLLQHIRIVIFELGGLEL
jgi:hypothetical protein